MAITPGSTAGWTATSEPARQGTSGDVGYDERAIARWVTVPFQTYEDSTMTVGVVAFHACGTENDDEGIAKVEFIANDGTAETVTEPTLNPATGYFEWWSTIETLGTDGFVEVRAIVYPHSGYCRVLQGGYIDEVGSNAPLPSSEESMILKSNANGTYDGLERWVATTGNDSTGDGSEGSPFLTIDKAVEDLGSSSSDSTIYLQAGTYQAPRSRSSGTWAETGWLTFQPAAGVSRSSVIISNGDGTDRTRVICSRWRDITFDVSGETGNSVFRGISSSFRVQFWFEGCDFTGLDNETNFVLYMLNNSFNGVDVRAYTASSENRTRFRNFDRGPQANFVQGIDIESCSNDIFTGNPITRDWTADDLIFVAGAHPDLWQSFAAPSNRILLDGYSINADIQSIFFDSDNADNLDTALINVHMQYVASPGGGGLRSQLSSADNLLIWHCSLDGQPLRLNTSASADEGVDDIGILSVYGCVFPEVTLNDTAGTGETTTTLEAKAGFLWDRNHYESSAWEPGTNTGSGAATYDGDYRPSGVDEVDALVRWDREQSARATALGSMGPEVTPATLVSAAATAGVQAVVLTFSEDVTYSQTGANPFTVTNDTGSTELSTGATSDGSVVTVTFSGDTPVFGDTNWTISLTNTGDLTTDSNSAAVENFADQAITVLGGSGGGSSVLKSRSMFLKRIARRNKRR
jgi:hypothetical protein